MKTHVKKCKTEKTLQEMIAKIIKKGGKFSVTGLTIRYSYPTKTLTNRLPNGTLKLIKEGKVTYRGCGMSGKYAGMFRLKVNGKEYIITSERLSSLQKQAGRKIRFKAPHRRLS